MKSISCITIWLFGALMVIASLDAIPDPPAVNPHSSNLSSHVRESQCAVREQGLDCDALRPSSHLQVRWTGFMLPYEPNRPSDWIALTGQAADTSPPAA